LRKQELVETFWQESDSGPPRRYYRQTAKGRAALRQFLPEWRSFVNKVDHLMKDVEL
jgi:PadR family transcriptional regulator PadR